MSTKEEKQKKNEYGAESIQVLENIEAVRKRPGMYIGSTDEQGWHHLAWEAIDNPVDEAVAGYCQKIWVTLSADQTVITIKDDGRGIPIEVHPKTKISVLRTIFEVLHSGGKFDDKAYKTSGGLHGVGVTVVNALSKFLRVESSREDKTEILTYERGKLTFSQIIDTPGRANGLLVEFAPDPEIFRDFTYFKVETIQRRLKELAYLNPNLTLYFATSPTAEPVIYNFTGGLKSWIEEFHAGRETLGEIFHQVVEEKAPEYFQLSLAFQYSNNYDKSNNRSFCNNIRTNGGGSHVSGFESGFFEVCKELVGKDNPNLDLELNDVLVGLTVIISIRIKEPEFAGQTKDRLANREVREKTKKITQELVSGFLQDNAVTAKLIKGKVVDNAKLRLHLKEEQDIFQGGKKNLDLIKVLSGSEENEEIFFVEGKSAGGSAEEGRDVKTQTVLALQGKPPNALKLVRRVLQNKQIHNILLALGFADSKGLLKNNYIRFRPWMERQVLDEEIALPEDFVYEEEGEKKIITADTLLSLEQLTIVVRETLKDLLGKSNFKKIILMADPDDDGAHIVVLLMTFIFRYLPYLIEGGKVFVVVPPFYRVQAKKQIHYFYDDQELETYRRSNPHEERKIERIKGLGQMDASELFESTMDPNQRRLYNINITDWSKCERIIQELMGTKSDKRKEYLEKRDYREASLTISEEKKINLINLLLVNLLRYAYAVVEDRALPNVHDGLKPVQRRILFAFYQMGITPNKSEVTSANIVGKTMSDWHPHGDQGIYNAMANMVRADKFRYPLVYGRGNFGYDKNPPAAMRYTKVKLTPFALHLLEDIAYGATEWKNNYDDTKGKEEPVILPTSLPNLLLNGSSGIAVGMTANIPPHHLGSTLTATINLISNPDLISFQKCQEELHNKEQQIAAINSKVGEISDTEKQLDGGQYNQLVEERKKSEEIFFQLRKKINQALVDDLQGPDFPTGGYVLEKEKLPSIYEKGEGTIYLRAKVQIFSSQEVKNGKELTGTEKSTRNIIWITELPYKVIKSTLVAQIAEIIKDKKIPGLKKVVDYSNRGVTDIRLEFDSQQYDGQIILNKLYKSTQLQINFGVKMRALMGNSPKIFSLTEIFQAFISNRLENIRRKSQFLSKENEKELVNLNTRLFIINNYQEIAEIVKGCPTEEECREQLKQKFSEIKQGQIRIENILSTSISFRQFTPEKQTDLTHKIADLKVENEKLGQLIDSKEKRKEKLISDLEQLKKDYEKDSRRTKIISDSHLIDERKAITPEEIIIILSQGEKKKTKTDLGEKDGKLASYLNIYKTNSLDATSFPSVGKELKTRGENLAIVKSNRRDDLWCFSNLGKLYIIPVYKLADKSINLKESGVLKLGEGEKIEQLISVREDFLTDEGKKEKFLVIGTKRGKIKRLPLEKIGRVSISGKKVINLVKHQDAINQVVFTSGQDALAVFTKRGKNKNLSEEKLRVFGRAAYGDTAIRLEDSGKKVRCPRHQSLLEQHKTASCCDKSKPGAQLQCSRIKEINKEKKDCVDCNKVISISTNSIKDEVISLLVIAKDLAKENMSLLALREDKTGIKKPLSVVFELAKRRGGKGKDRFKIEEKYISPYCAKHEDLIAKLEEKRENTREKIKERQREIAELENILNQAKTEEVNAEVINKYEQELMVVRQVNKEWEEKLKKRRVELEQAKKKAKGGFDEKTKKKIEPCANCRRNCNRHEDLKINHEQDNCCDKKKTEIEAWKERISQAKNKGIKTETIKKYEKEYRDLRQQSLKNRVKCPRFQTINQEVRECTECQLQKTKKAVKITANPVKKVLLVNKQVKPEIYLLVEEVTCWYNKKDLSTFFQDEKKKKIQLYKGSRTITDFNLYGVE